MAFKKENYPPYWKMFSEYIRFERAGNKCERCGAKNGYLKFYSDFFDGGFYIIDADERSIRNIEYALKLNGVKKYRISKIVLTVAHLDHARGVCRCKKTYGFKCAKPSHVRALCQSCHLSLDRPRHLAVRAKKLAAKKDAERKLFEII